MPIKKLLKKKGGSRKARKAGLPEPAIEKNVKSRELIFGKFSVKISNPSKLYFPKERISKGMVVDYYQKIANYILPFMKDRPESLRRNPNGIGDEGFFQKDAGAYVPDWVKRTSIYSETAKKNIDYILCNDAATLAYLNNLGCIEFNPWNSTVRSLEKPDYMIIDLDPSEKNSFDQVVETAIAFRHVLERAGLEALCKTSGATGLHIYVPMGKKYSYEQARNLAQLLCTLVADQVPFTTLERNLQKRGTNKIYLDYLQNKRGQTVACAYSLRPKAGATVSTPLEWGEVKLGLSPLAFNMHNIFERLAQKGDLFKGIFSRNNDLTKALSQLS